MLRGSVPVAGAGSQAVHRFSQAPQASIPRSTFDRSHGVKTTFDEGYLIPVLADEMLPGDTFKLRMHAFARMATPKYPLMDNLYLESFFFAVPYRLVWDHWEQFNGYQKNPTDTTDYTIPWVGTDGTTNVTGSLWDYFGIPIGIDNLNVNSLHPRAYNLIWNEWFRDQNLQDSVPQLTNDGGGGDDISNYVLLQRGKRHDYFTSCLPFPQKGPDVLLPLGTTAPVILASPPTNAVLLRDANAQGLRSSVSFATTGAGGEIRDTALAPVLDVFDPNGSLVADLTDATAATINQLRLAFQTQKLYERDARGGTRYTEVIHAHFGVVSPDMRLQRPEYLGGGTSPILVNPIAQTSPTSGANAMGQLAAYGVSVVEGHGFVYSATEHMLIIGLVSVRADINYQQGLNRMWSRQTRLDYYWPALSHIGEQAVLNQEIYAQGTDDDQGVFGYQERHAEYRYKPNLITGQFNSGYSTPLDAWHLAQYFTMLPVLNDEFIVEDAPMARVEALDDQVDFLFDCQFEYHCARPMPAYAVPGLVDHF